MISGGGEGGPHCLVSALPRRTNFFGEKGGRMVNLF